VALAVNLVMAVDDPEAQQRYLPPIARGESIATVALLESSAKWNEGSVGTRADDSGDGFTLHGEKLYVLDGHVADVIFVVARTVTGISLFGVDRRDARGMTVQSMATIDLTRKQSRIVFDGTPAVLVGRAGEGWPAVSKMLQLAAIALAADQVGGARRCLEMAVDYAKAREQFGRPIGSFQAVKHRLAEMLIDVERGTSALYHGAWTVAEGGDAAVATSLAKACCSTMYERVTAENIQVHGGIGFTWEHTAHLYYRRARADAVFLGGAAEHVADMVGHIGL
jgi:alkylation response protein AidB-like acyl-CoA dehydrogenase